MAKFHLSRIEQETVINFNAAEETIDLHTSDPAWLRKMDKLVEKNPEQFKLIRVDKCQGEIVAKRYMFPKRFVTIRSGDKKRELTDAQRKELAERMKQGRKKAVKSILR